MRRVNEEQGAAAVFVALLLVVMFGMGALVLDVGHMFWERRQLQNGADGGSLAVAQDLARMVVDGEPLPSTGPLGAPFLSTAEHYADSNSADGEAEVEELTLDTVDGKPLTQAGKVTVTTLVAGGELSHWLAPVLGIDSSPVRATAAAIYGPLVKGEAFPFAACTKLWDEHGPPDSTPVEIRYKGTGDNPAPDYGCDIEEQFRPGDNPGGFGWQETDDGCATDFDVSGDDTTSDAGPNVGVDTPNECHDDVDEIVEAIEDPTKDLEVRVIPVFSKVEGQGANATYTLTHFAAFEFWGVSMERAQWDSVLPPGWVDETECVKKQHRCVKGRFIKEVGIGTVDPDFKSDAYGVMLVE